MIDAEYYISGKVQGVFFRKYAQEYALAHKLVGFVKNLPDGRVYAVCQGELPDIEQIEGWMHYGPAGAHVEAVESNARQISHPEYEGFEIR
ncbi:acylphosphatase [Patescibacteria group bacterium]